MHRSFADFYADTYGVRTRYLAMLGRVAGAFAGSRASSATTRSTSRGGTSVGRSRRCTATPPPRSARHPSAILFLEARGPAAAGFRTRLPDRASDNIAFAPHYYHPLAIVREDWGGQTAAIDRAFDRMEAKADEWGVPLLLGEFGIPGDARRAGDYVDYLYDRLDAVLASGMQWTVSPRWTPEAGDGWNGEDFSLLDGRRPAAAELPAPPLSASGGRCARCLRFEPNAPPRGEPRLEFVWAHRPGLGPTEIVVPAGLFPPGSRPRTEPDDATCLWDPSRRLLTCDAPRPVTIRVVLESP